MVKATRGVLIRTDVPTKVFIVHLDESKPPGERFVLDKGPFDESTLLVKEQALEYIKEELKKHKLAITYQPPVDKKFA